MNDLAAFVGPKIEWFSISPLLALLAGALILLLIGSLTNEWPKHWYSLTAVFTSAMAIGLLISLWINVSNDGAKLLIGGSLTLDHFAILGSIAVCASVLLVSLISSDYLTRSGSDAPEIYALYLTAAIGAVVMISANDLIVLFLIWALVICPAASTSTGLVATRNPITATSAPVFSFEFMALLFMPSPITRRGFHLPPERNYVP